jgi:hypothetical protein
MQELAYLSIFTRLLSGLGVGFPLEGGSSLHYVQIFLGAHPVSQDGYQKILTLKRTKLQRQELHYIPACSIELCCHSSTHSRRIIIYLWSPKYLAISLLLRHSAWTLSIVWLQYNLLKPTYERLCFLFNQVNKIRCWRELPTVFILVNKTRLILRLVCSDSGRQIAWKIIICTAVHKTVGSSIMTSLDIILLATGIWRGCLDFWKIYGPLPTLWIKH